MPEPSLAALIVIVVLALGFGFVNGMNDAANAIATVIGTRTLTPQKAVMLAAVFNLLGALTGSAVAVTIGKGILAPEDIKIQTIIDTQLAKIIRT